MDTRRYWELAEEGKKASIDENIHPLTIWHVYGTVTPSEKAFGTPARYSKSYKNEQGKA